MIRNNLASIPRGLLYGIYFVAIGLIINYLYRTVLGLGAATPDKVILNSDPQGYYQYLPTFFLQNWSEFKNLVWAIPYGEDRTLSVFTCGVAILWSPFFLMAHFITLLAGVEANGYGDIYYFSVIIAAIVYAYIALYFIYKILIKHFSPKESLITISLLFLCTNIFYYTVIMGAGMSHAYSFTMIAIYIYFVHRYFETRNIKHLIFFALPFAMAVLIRPTNIIAGFYFFLYGVYNGQTLLERGRYWINNFYAIGVVILAGLIVFIPQMLYWHTVTGSFIVYSYQDFGFPYLLNPKIGIVLFGAQNGWLTYTPLVVFALYGLYKAFIDKKYNSPAIIIILILAIYINASWWAPTFSAAVGQRAMIDFLPFLALPLALVVRSYFKQPAKTKRIILVLLAAIIYFNIKFAFRYGSGFWWKDPFTWEKLMKVLSF